MWRVADDMLPPCCTASWRYIAVKCSAAHAVSCCWHACNRQKKWQLSHTCLLQAVICRFPEAAVSGVTHTAVHLHLPLLCSCTQCCSRCPYALHYSRSTSTHLACAAKGIIGCAGCHDHHVDVCCCNIGHLQSFLARFCSVACHALAFC